MINTVPSAKPFNTVSKRLSSQEFWLPVEKKENLISADENSVIENEEIIKPKKRYSKKFVGYSIAGATLLTAAGIFVVLKGGTKGVWKLFENLKNHYELRSQKLKLDAESNPIFLSLNELLVRTFNYAKSKTEIINNFTTLKDYSLKRLMCHKDGIGAKIHNGITTLYERIGKRTVNDSYNTFRNSLSKTIETTDNINGQLLRSPMDEIIEINGKKQNRAEWLEILIKKNNELLENFDKNFSSDKIEHRYRTLKNATKELEKDFDKKGYLWFWSPETLKTFVADTKLLADKTKIHNEVKNYRHNISYSLSDMIKDSQDKILNMTKSIKYNDTEKIKILRELNRDFKALEKSTDDLSITKIKNNISKNIEVFKNSILTSGNIDQKIVEKLVKDADSLNNFKDFKKGKIEEILEIYKVLLPKEKYTKLENLYKESIKSLDSSIRIETEDFVNKLRDLTLGSAPTDIVTMLSGFATLGYFLLKSDNNQERAGVALKYGIPALTFIGTSLYFNAKLFAGSKSLIYGGIATWIVGKIGEIANNLLIYHLKKTGQYIEPSKNNAN